MLLNQGWYRGGPHPPPIFPQGAPPPTLRYPRIILMVGVECAWDPGVECELNW